MSDIYELYAHEQAPADEIICDPSSGLPLLEYQDGVLRLIHSHLPLPYSVVEFGCGQKASIVLRMLNLHHRMPAHALRRGLVLERDLGAEMLRQEDPAQRPHALMAANRLVDRVETDNEEFRRFVEESGDITAVEEDRILGADGVCLSLDERVQFVKARSHVFAVILFWDDKESKVAPRVIDLTLERNRLFEITKVRDYLDAPEAWIMLAPLMANFRLVEDFLTEDQRSRVDEELGEDEALTELSHERHAELFREISGAPEGSLGDPMTWSSTNNIYVEREGAPNRDLRRKTGRGDSARKLTGELIAARREGDEERTRELRGELAELEKELKLRRELQEEAERSEDELAPLAAVANTLACFHSMRALSRKLEAGEISLAKDPDPELLREMHGIGVRLRRRIEAAARCSRDEDGCIDARALNQRYVRTAVETLAQMKRAGLTVFIDRVGNFHGLQLEEEEFEDLRAGKRKLREFTQETLCLGSHIDTVSDAGKYDGRLGVFSGIEVARVLRDLKRHFSDPFAGKQAGRLMVSVFSAEEMTFTGEGVSLPGSAAVSGLADIESIRKMTNANDESYGELLDEMACHLTQARDEGRMHCEGLPADAQSKNPLADAPDPIDFFPRLFWERHIEQGLVLHRHEVPLVLSRAIAGIRHEDWHFEGADAERIGWEFIRRCRELLEREEYADARLTCGMFTVSDAKEHSVCRASRWRIEGSSNHAGSTALRDRRDAAVGAARLASHFVDACSALDLEVVIAGGELMPGRNRNSIAGAAQLELGVTGDMGDSSWNEIEQSLQAFAREVLAEPVADGGEGVQVEPVESGLSSLKAGRKVRVSTDLRLESADKMKALRGEISRTAEELCEEHGAKHQAKLHQDFPPVDLEEAGLVLQMERSYGGSHNPKETELAIDVLRGTLFQLMQTIEVLRSDSEEPLYQRTRRALPDAWAKLEFVSGGLHDSANLATRMLEREGINPDRPQAGGR